MTPKEIRKSLKEHDAYLDSELDEELREVLKERAQRFLIDANNLDEEISKQPAEYAYFAYCLAAHETIRAKRALTVKLVEARIRKAVHEEDPRDGRKGGPTLAQIDATVQNDEVYQNAVVELKNAEHRVSLLTADVTASAQKAAMLKIIAPLTEREKQAKGYVDGEKTKKRA